MFLSEDHRTVGCVRKHLDGNFYVYLLIPEVNEPESKQFSSIRIEKFANYWDAHAYLLTQKAKEGANDKST